MLNKLFWEVRTYLSVRLLSAVLILGFCQVSFASNPVFIKDIDLEPGQSFPRDFFTHNGLMYFIANDGKVGSEVWVSDGTVEGTVLLKDINEGSKSMTASENVEFFAFGSNVYFGADSGVEGHELWMTDGTSVGTQLVRDIGPPDVFENSGTADDTNVRVLGGANGNLFFAVDDGVIGRELWKSDGTEVGTQLVKDINLGEDGSSPDHMVSIGDIVYFSADDGVNGEELWKSDGTESGTQMVANISTGGNSSRPDQLTVLNGNIIFVANNGVTGREPWLFDTVAESASLIKDVNDSPTQIGSNPNRFTVLGSEIFFVADVPAHGREVWKTDGTEVGTVLVEDINTAGGNGQDSDPNSLVAANGNLFFTANDGVNGRELWKTDGSNTSIVKVISDDNFSFSELSTDGTNIYFSTSSSGNGVEPWMSDGTELGTFQLKDIVTGEDDFGRAQFGFVDNKVFFSTEDQDDGENIAELWTTDGTDPGTTLFKDLNLATSSSSPSSFTDLNGILMFEAASVGFGSELWKSDGTTDGTVMVKDLNPGDDGADPFDFMSFGNLLYFQENSTSVGPGQSLWRSDATEPGTFKLREFYSIGEMVSFDGNTVYFLADEPQGDIGLWSTDGTIIGTQLVFDLPDPFFGYELFIHDGMMYFAAEDGGGNIVLWISDGTNGGTQQIQDVSPAGNIPPFGFAVANSTLYFFAGDSSTTSDAALWKTDGTAPGTEMIVEGFESISGVGVRVFNSILYFFAETSDLGTELWKSDGTADGTVNVIDIVADEGSVNPDDDELFFVGGNKLYFRINDLVHGEELWVSDGTESGTFMLRDINGRPEGSDIDDFWVDGGTVYFEANDDIHGEELWITEGTTASTRLYKDILPGPQGSDPDHTIKIGNYLFFELEDGVHGDELWKLDISNLCATIEAANGNVVSFCL